MAATLTVIKSIPRAQSEVEDVVTVLMDSAYPTGGEAIDASGDLGYSELRLQPAGGYTPVWDRANQKVLAYYGDNNNAADGPLIEVAAAVDLSAVTFRGRGIRTT